MGYLNLRQFTQSARGPLSAASEFFQLNGVTDFVIDLRYNGGGLLSVADLMLDLFGGRIADQQTSFIWLTMNDVPITTPMRTSMNVQRVWIQGGLSLSLRVAQRLLVNWLSIVSRRTLRLRWLALTLEEKL